MSGFTIDIQLTELGFPDLFQNGNTRNKTSSATASDNSSCTLKTHPNSQTSSPSSFCIHNSLTNSSPSPITCNYTNALPANNFPLKPLQGSDSLPDPGSNTDHDSHPQERLQIIDPQNVTGHKYKPSQSSSMAPKLVSKLKTVLVKSKGPHKPHNADKKQKGRRPKRDAGAIEMEMDSAETDNSDTSEEDEDEEEEMAVSDIPTDSMGKHFCKVCNLTLPSAFRLQEHMHLHSGERPYRCAECGKRFCHLVNYRTHLRKHAQAAGIRCRICNTGFDTLESLQVHMECVHLRKRIYQCDICNLIFGRLDECQHHANQHQNECTWHQCPQCGCQFRRHKSLLRHLERHERRPSYVCTQCGQAFPKKTALLRHSFSHLGLLPYTCIRCQRHFRLASLYHKHVCVPERIQCMACLAFFDSQRDFVRHKEETGCWGHLGARVDGPRCMECGQAFESAEELKKHAGAHQRVLTCSECGKGFRSSLLLMSHMGGHAGSRPCLCQHCGLGFPHQQAYESHQKHCVRVLSGSGPSADNTDQSKKRSVRSDKSSASQDKVWQIKLNESHPPVATLIMIVPLQARSSAQLGTTMLSKVVPPEDSVLCKKEKLSPSVVCGPLEEVMQMEPSMAPEDMRTEWSVLKASGGDKDCVDSRSREGLELEMDEVGINVKKEREQMQDEEKTATGGLEQARIIMKHKTKVIAREGTACESMEIVLPSKMVKGMSHMVKQEHVCASNVQSEIVFSPLKAKEEATSIINGGLELVDLIQARYEIVSDERINMKQVEDSQDSNDVGANVEDRNSGNVADFHYVEVEVWDEMAEDNSGDEPHECVNCGQILLDGNLLEHYMQHASKSDLPFPESSAPTQSQPLLSSFPSPLKRKQRHRKRP
ncbi:zinc finger and SCAN domain-containing protein 12 isoform X2 [Brienomyrus brachyistius]|nr:zinc finger and SCAN domain-containing protein 12 isoform X2 [Brienomyrus brachyistius]